MLQGEAKPLGVKRHGARDILHLIAKSVDGIDDDGWTDWRRLSLHGGRLLACACIDRRASRGASDRSADRSEPWSNDSGRGGAPQGHARERREAANHHVPITSHRIGKRAGFVVAVEERPAGEGAGGRLRPRSYV